MKPIQSIGIIMDGNRRWAKAEGLPSLEGHRRGLDKVKELVSWVQDAGIKELVLYAFSTENWNRTPVEVEYLMKLFENAFGKEIDEMIEKEVRVRFIGQRDRLPVSLQKKIDETEERTKGGAKSTLVIALSYGGRAEIVAGVNALLSQKVESVDESSFRKALWGGEFSDPDLIIRTGGDKRLSNFLTWQSVYSELFFTDTKWPAFEKTELDAILAEYALREQRRGV
ncbi:MAG: polyprenyl diphosphate synthase [Patescibacteria group bacterium]